MFNSPKHAAHKDPPQKACTSCILSSVRAVMFGSTVSTFAPQGQVLDSVSLILHGDQHSLLHLLIAQASERTFEKGQRRSLWGSKECQPCLPTLGKPPFSTKGAWTQSRKPHHPLGVRNATVRCCLHFLNFQILLVSSETMYFLHNSVRCSKLYLQCSKEKKILRLSLQS